MVLTDTPNIRAAVSRTALITQPAAQRVSGVNIPKDQACDETEVQTAKMSNDSHASTRYAKAVRDSELSSVLNSANKKC